MKINEEVMFKAFNCLANGIDFEEEDFKVDASQWVRDAGLRSVLSYKGFYVAFVSRYGDRYVNRDEPNVAPKTIETIRDYFVKNYNGYVNETRLNLLTVKEEDFVGRTIDDFRTPAMCRLSCMLAYSYAPRDCRDIYEPDKMGFVERRLSSEDFLPKLALLEKASRIVKKVVFFGGWYAFLDKNDKLFAIVRALDGIRVSNWIAVKWNKEDNWFETLYLESGNKDYEQAQLAASIVSSRAYIVTQNSSVLIPFTDTKGLFKLEERKFEYKSIVEHLLDEGVYVRCERCGAITPNYDSVVTAGEVVENWCYNCIEENTFYSELSDRRYSSLDFESCEVADYDCYGDRQVETWAEEEAEDEGVIMCESCGYYFRPYNILRIGGRDFCNRCGRSSLINGYHHSGGAKYVKVGDEDKDDDLWEGLGVEVEFENENGSDSEAVETVYAVNEDFGGHFVYETDGSLSYGYECILTPHTWEEFNKINWKHFFDVLSDHNSTSGTDACGLHVHLSRNMFKNSPSGMRDSVARLLYLYNRWFFPIADFGGRDLGDTGYCERTGLFESVDDARDWYDSHNYGCSRYYAVNLCNGSTVEIRIMAGAVDYEDFKNRTNFVYETAKAACNMTDEEAKDINNWLNALDVETRKAFEGYLKCDYSRYE